MWKFCLLAPQRSGPEDFALAVDHQRPRLGTQYRRRETCRTGQWLHGARFPSAVPCTGRGSCRVFRSTSTTPPLGNCFVPYRASNTLPVGQHPAIAGRHVELPLNRPLLVDNHHPVGLADTQERVFHDASAAITGCDQAEQARQRHDREPTSHRGSTNPNEPADLLMNCGMTAGLLLMHSTELAVTETGDQSIRNRSHRRWTWTGTQVPGFPPAVQTHPRTNRGERSTRSTGRQVTSSRKNIVSPPTVCAPM